MLMLFGQHGILEQLAYHIFASVSLSLTVWKYAWYTVYAYMNVCVYMCVYVSLLKSAAGAVL